MWVTTVGVTKGNTRSLDCGSHAVMHCRAPACRWQACAFAHTELELGKPIIDGGPTAAPTPAANVMRPGDWKPICIQASS